VGTGISGLQSRRHFQAHHYFIRSKVTKQVRITKAEGKIAISLLIDRTDRLSEYGKLGARYAPFSEKNQGFDNFASLFP
jgi:hypothetical protein